MGWNRGDDGRCPGRACVITHRYGDRRNRYRPNPLQRRALPNCTTKLRSHSAAGRPGIAVERVHEPRHRGSDGVAPDDSCHR